MTLEPRSITAYAAAASITIVLIATHALAQSAVATTRCGFSMSSSPIRLVGDVDGEQEYVFGSIVAVRLLDDGTLLVADGSIPAVRAFDPRGGLMWSFGRRGRGPGEFTDIVALWTTDQNEIQVYSGLDARITGITSSGDYVGTSGLPRSVGLAWPMGVTGSGQFMLIRPRNPRLDRSLGPLIQDSLDVFVQVGPDSVVALMTIPAQPRVVVSTDTWARYPFAPLSVPPTATARADRLVVGAGQAPKLSIFDADGTPRGTREWSTENRRVLREHRSDVVRKYLAEYARGRDVEVWRRFAERVSLPDSLPTYARVILGADQTIWILQYSPSGHEDQWLVLEDGRTEPCSVTVPTNFKLLDATASAVAGVLVDSLGVNRAAEYRLERPR